MQHLKEYDEYDEFINEGLSVLSILNWANSNKELKLYIKSGHYNDLFIEQLVNKNFHREPKTVRDKLISAMSKPEFSDFYKKYIDYDANVKGIIARNMTKEFFGIEKNILK